MTDEQIKQNAEEHLKQIPYYGEFLSPMTLQTIKEAHTAGAHSRDEEIKKLNGQVALHKDRADYYHDLYMKLRNPWHHVNDQMPKEREKIFFRENDGATYYGWFDERMQSFFTIAPDCTKWTVNGVTHWMPIPESKKGE